MPAPKEIEVQGFRMKWSCRTCGKRNDTRLIVPCGTNDVYVCKFCKKASTFTFTQQQVLTSADPPEGTGTG